MNAHAPLIGLTGTCLDGLAEQCTLLVQDLVGSIPCGLKAKVPKKLMVIVILAGNSVLTVTQLNCCMHGLMLEYRE